MTTLAAIRRKVSQTLAKLVEDVDRTYLLGSHCPLLFNWMKEFVLHNGKNIRSSLFIIGYSAFSGDSARNLYRSAAALELAHDFVLIHDDIIDRADLRRGVPALNRRIGDYLKRLDSSTPLRGEDFSLVMGDILYALSMQEFLAVKADPVRKMKALRIFLESGFQTGNGQFIELVNGLRRVSEITPDEIYRTYDLKTACYTFAGPLAAGATLGGASEAHAKKLYDTGLLLGRAYQIRNDILDLFSETPSDTASFRDVTDAKRTILLWYAWHHGSDADRIFLEELLAAPRPDGASLRRFAGLVRSTGSLRHAEEEIGRLVGKAFVNGSLSVMKAGYAGLLEGFSRELLSAGGQRRNAAPAESRSQTRNKFCFSLPGSKKSPREARWSRKNPGPRPPPSPAKLP